MSIVDKMEVEDLVNNPGTPLECAISDYVKGLRSDIKQLRDGKEAEFIKMENKIVSLRDERFVLNEKCDKLADEVKELKERYEKTTEG